MKRRDSCATCGATDAHCSEKADGTRGGPIHPAVGAQRFLVTPRSTIRLALKICKDLGIAAIGRVRRQSRNPRPSIWHAEAIQPVLPAMSTSDDPVTDYPQTFKDLRACRRWSTAVCDVPVRRAERPPGQTGTRRRPRPAGAGGGLQHVQQANAARSVDDGLDHAHCLDPQAGLEVPNELNESGRRRTGGTSTGPYLAPHDAAE